jgi:spore coat polysaccharide biosynthesis predicted glycosyltransferase SpsG/L-amino acid N-acyltransferase YncA
VCEESGSAGMIVFRCDASDSMGYGHFFRCLSLASAAANQGRTVRIVTQANTPTIQHYTDVHSISVWEGELTSELLHMWNTQWLVFDGYHIPQSTVEDFASEFQVVAIDDLAVNGIFADILLNPNYGSDRLSYNTGKSTTRLLGPGYAPLRPEFTEQTTVVPEPKTVFVCLGGGDNTVMLSRVLSAIPEEWAVTVVPGRSNVGNCAPNVQIVRDPPNMAEMMKTCGKAIVGAGSTVWECLALGLDVAAVKLVENQDIVARELSAKGCIDWLNPEGDLRTEYITQFLSAEQKSAEVPETWRDGAGVFRVLTTMDAQTTPISIRRAQSQDVRAIWEINNDPRARANAVQQASIPFEDHLTWFEASLANRTRLLWVLPDVDDRAIGVVRADIVNNDARISIALAPAARGKRLGQRILGEAIQRLLCRPDVRSISAIIRPENTPSLAIFERLEFHYQRDETLNGERFLYYQRV